jgi:hypothetical protein
MHFCSGVDNNPLANALQRKKELQDAVKVAMEKIANVEAEIKALMKELERVDIFIKEFGRFSGRGSPVATHEITTLSVAGHGNAQELFEQRARAAILDLGRPIDTGEMVDVFRKRGYPIGGNNEWKTASNRLWKAKSQGRFLHTVGVGYWPADLPYPDADALATAPPKPPKAKRGEAVPGRAHRATGRPMGRLRRLSDEQLQRIYELARTGMSASKIGMEMGGLSPSSIYNYIGMGVSNIAYRKKTNLPEPPPDLRNKN